MNKISAIICVLFIAVTLVWAVSRGQFVKSRTIVISPTHRLTILPPSWNSKDGDFVRIIQKGKTNDMAWSVEPQPSDNPKQVLVLR